MENTQMNAVNEKPTEARKLKELRVILGTDRITKRGYFDVTIDRDWVHVDEISAETGEVIATAGYYRPKCFNIKFVEESQEPQKI